MVIRIFTNKHRLHACVNIRDENERKEQAFRVIVNHFCAGLSENARCYMEVHSFSPSRLLRNWPTFKLHRPSSDLQKKTEWNLFNNSSAVCSHLFICTYLLFFECSNNSYQCFFFFFLSTRTHMYHCLIVIVLSYIRVSCGDDDLISGKSSHPKSTGWQSIHHRSLGEPKGGGGGVFKAI